MSMYKITEEFIENYISELLCSYSQEAHKKLLSFEAFSPQSFVVSDKRDRIPLLYFNDITYEDWIRDMILDQLDKLDLSCDEVAAVCRQTLENLDVFLRFEHNGTPVAHQLYNQEFVDSIRKILLFTIEGTLEKELHPAQSFNHLADSFMPLVLSKIRQMGLSRSEIFKLSIASGLSGLDLKGAPSASSTYASTGISMRPYYGMAPQTAAEDYLAKLLTVMRQSTTPAFDWTSFQTALSGAKRLVWMTDDYIESYFDLYFISLTLAQYPDLSVEIIPKNGRYGNDLSWTDLDKMLELPVFEPLKPYRQENRLQINRYGPKMGAANIRKLSDISVRSLLSADFVLLKGCRIHEMLQGGLNVDVFCSYTVSRTLSETVTGYNSKEYPILFFHLRPKEYAFFGMDPANAKTVDLPDGRRIVCCMSTLSDHIKRKNMSSPEEIEAEIQWLAHREASYIGNTQPIRNEMDILKEKLALLTGKG